MIVVIQCAASKQPDAGYFQYRDGRKVLFVADPHHAPLDTPFAYAHPDHIADTGRCWKDELFLYNDSPEHYALGPLGLLPAWQLYANETYALLAKKYGIDHLYILSAGWGLIAGDYLLPNYDITFSPQADRYKRRRGKDHYDDLCMLPEDTEEPVVFFVSKQYVPLACELTNGIKSPRYLFYNSATAPDAPGCILKKYDTRTRTNWHYECAKAFMDGSISV